MSRNKYQPRQTEPSSTSREISIHYDSCDDSNGKAIDRDLDVVIALPNRSMKSPASVNPQGEYGQLDVGEIANVRKRVVTPSVIRVPQIHAPPNQFRLLQQWEGTVTSVGAEDFVAQLKDLTRESSAREEAMFPREEIAADDLALLVPGAVFRWNIGYRTSVDGQRERISNLRFVRIPGWRKSVIQRIKDSARELMEQFPLDELRNDPPEPQRD